MTNLGNLTLGLQIEDRKATQDLLAFEKLARRVNNDIVVNIRVKDDKFLKAIENAQKAKDRFRGAVTTEFKVNATQFFSTEKAVTNARKEFNKPITQKIRVASEEYKQDLRGARRAASEFRSEFSGRSIKLPRIDSAGFERNLRATGTRGGDILTGIFQGIGQQITQTLTNAIQGGLRAGAGAIGGSLREFADFDQQLNLLAVRTGATREELADFEKVALEVGLTTSKLPAEAAAAGVELAQLGVKIPGLVENLDDVVGASEATGISITGLGRALQVGANIFGDAGENIESLADKVTVLANTTAITSETDFLQFLSKAGASAQQIGLDFNQLGAAVATVRDLGASPEVAATGITALFTRLRGTTDEAKAALDDLELQTGLQIKLFDELGNLRIDPTNPNALAETLGNLGQALDQFSDEDRFDIIGEIFGTGSRGGAQSINLLLKGLETNYKDTLERLTAITGEETEEASKVLISGFSGTIRFIQGTFSTLQIGIGQALAGLFTPVNQAFADSFTEFVRSDPFAPVQESAERLAAALFKIPGLGDAITTAFNQITGAGIDSISGTLDGITAFLEENPDALTNFVSNFTSGFLEINSVISRVFGELSEILSPIAGIAANLFQGLVDQGDLLVGTLDVLGNILAPVTATLKALSDNAFLVDVAFKTIIAANLINTIAGLITPLVSLGGAALSTATALSAAAAAGNFTAFSAALAPVTALTGGLATLGATAVAVLGPLAALAAAIAAVQFIKAAQDARVLNDEIQALNNATNTVGETGIQAAQRLNSAIREGNEARKEGLDIDKEAIQERIRLAEQEQKAIAEQRRELERQLSEVPGGSGGIFGFGKGVNDAQRLSIQDNLNQLDAAEKALTGQIGRAQDLLNSVTADTVGAEADAANEVGAIGEEQVQEFAQREAKKKELVEQRLKEIEAITQASNQRIAREESEAISGVLQQQLSGSLTENQAQEEISKIQAATLESQRAAVEEQIRLTNQLESEQVLSAEETAAKVAELEAEKSRLVQTQLERQVQSQIEAERQRREAAVSEFEKFNDAAIDAFDGRADALQEQLDAEADAQVKAFEESQKLAEKELEFRNKQLEKRQEAEKKALAERQQLERDEQNQKLSALERFVDRELQLEQAATKEERKRLEEEFAAEDDLEKRRRELQEEALRNSGRISRLDERARGEGLTPFEKEERSFEERQAEEQEKLAAKQEAQQEKLALLREEQEDRFAEKRETLDTELAAKREVLEEQIADDRRTLEDELALRRQEAETGLQQDRAAFAAEQRQLDINAANEVASILASARPQALTARRHGGPVGPDGSFLVGERPDLGPELGVFGGKPFLFTEPTILNNPPSGRIYSPEQTKRMMTPATPASTAQGGDAALLNEVRELRQQLGRVRDVMPLLDALSQNLAKDTGQMDRDRRFENARWRLGGI